MTTARASLGQRETPGLATSPFVGRMLAKLHAWWKDDETAWCATFASWCLEENGFDYPKAFYRARAFLSWGRPFVTLAVVPYGAVAVLSRPPSTTDGHVGFVVGMLREQGQEYVYLLGGNQENQVCVRRYPQWRVLAYRWPHGVPVTGYKPDVITLARMLNGVTPSTTEA